MAAFSRLMELVVQEVAENSAPARFLEEQRALARDKLRQNNRGFSPGGTLNRSVTVGPPNEPRELKVRAKSLSTSDPFRTPFPQLAP